MSEHKVLPDFQIEIKRAFLTEMAESKLKEVDQKITDRCNELIKKEANRLVKLTVGTLWWKKPRYSMEEAEKVASEIILNGKLPGSFYEYDYPLHGERMDLLISGYLPRQSKFLRELISIDTGSIGVKLNSAAYEMLTK